MISKVFESIANIFRDDESWVHEFVDGEEVFPDAAFDLTDIQKEEGATGLQFDTGSSCKPCESHAVKEGRPDIIKADLSTALEIHRAWNELAKERRKSWKEAAGWMFKYFLAYVLGMIMVFFGYVMVGRVFWLPIMGISFSVSVGAVNATLADKFKAIIPQGQAPKSPAQLRAERLANWNLHRTRISIWSSNVPSTAAQNFRSRDFAGNWALFALSINNGTAIPISGGGTYTQDAAGKALWDRYFNNSDVNERGFLDDLTAHYFGANGKSASGSRHFFKTDLNYANQQLWFTVPAEMINVGWGTGVTEQYNAYARFAVSTTPHKVETLSRVARLLHQWGYNLAVLVDTRPQVLFAHPLGFTHPQLTDDQATACRSDINKIIAAMTAQGAENKKGGTRKAMAEVTGLFFFKKA